MINLLPTYLKQDIQFARRNSMLLKWVVKIALATFVAGLIVWAGTYYISKSVSNYSKQFEADRKTLDVKELDAAQKQLSDISSSVKLVIQVLSRQVLFSQLLRQLGFVTPSRVVLTGLNIQELQGAVSLTIEARDVQAATQFQINIADPENKIFDKADIESIACASPGEKLEENRVYRCLATIKARFGANNPYLFITKPAGGN